MQIWHVLIQSFKAQNPPEFISCFWNQKYGSNKLLRLFNYIPFFSNFLVSFEMNYSSLQENFSSTSYETLNKIITVRVY